MIIRNLCKSCERDKLNAIHLVDNCHNCIYKHIKGKGSSIRKRILIDITYGSQFQFQIWEKSIIAMINAWQYMMQAKHKNNKCNFKIEDV